jgi:hypothetical protein
LIGAKLLSRKSSAMRDSIQLSEPIAGAGSRHLTDAAHLLALLDPQSIEHSALVLGGLAQVSPN